MKEPLAIAFILPFAALALQWVLWPWIEPFVWFLFLPTVLVAARLTGYRGGLITAALSAPIAWYFFIPPRLSWQLERPSNVGSIVLFVVVAYLICELQRRLEKEHAETAAALAEARAANDRLARLHDEHRRTDAQLREREAALREAQRLAGIGNWRWDFHRDMSIWSDELYRIFGRDPALPPAGFETVSRYFAPESWQRLSAAVRAASEEGLPYKLDVELVQADGSRRWVLARGEAVRDETGQVVALRGTMQDITERHQSELELRTLRTEMEQMLGLHVASQTAAAIAHELNQPLNAITTYTEAAKRLLQAGNPQPERLLHALESSARQAQRAGAVMRELLGFLHKGEAVAEAVDLNKAVRRALAIVESNGVGGFQSVVELAPHLRPVWANRVQLEKVLVNLISNAVDAMRQAGVARQRITVAVGTAASEEMAHVTVSDVGPGLDEQTARRVFEPFFSTKPKGLGLGLAISRSLVETHGGRLWVESTPGAGATFHFTLPFAP